MHPDTVREILPCRSECGNQGPLVVSVCCWHLQDFKTSEVRETGVNVLPGSCVGQQLYPACQGVADDPLPCVRVRCHVGNSPAGSGRRRRARRRTGFDAGVSWSRGRSRGINLQPAQRGKCHVESGTVPLALCYQRPYLFLRIATLPTPAVAGSPATARIGFRLWLGRETSIASITAACHPAPPQFQGKP
jgi:hypothetical protein